MKEYLEVFERKIKLERIFYIKLYEFDKRQNQKALFIQSAIFCNLNNRIFVLNNLIIKAPTELEEFSQSFMCFKGRTNLLL